VSELLEAALACFEAGQPVIAVRENKRPYRSGWNRYFKERQTEDDVREEFSNGAWGIAKVLYPACSDVHLDFDGPHAEAALVKTGISLPETARQTTVHGWHLIYKTSKLLRDLMRESKVKRKIRLIECACDCEKPCGVDLLVNGYAIIQPTPGYNGDPDFPTEDTVEIPDAIVKLAIARDGTNGEEAGRQGKGKIREGKRNATLTSLAGTMRRRGMTFEEIFAALCQANKRRCDPPLGTTEVRQIARSVSRYEPKPDDDISEIQNLTDLGNAKRFAGLHAGSVFYSAERRKWILWNGRFWEWDIDGKIIDLAEDVLKSIYTEAAEAKEKDLREALARHAVKTESRRQIEAMLALALAQPEIRTGLTVFDRDPYLFNAANATIDLRTGKARDFKREDYLTRISPTFYHPQAESPLFNTFINAITLKRTELASFIQRAAGYSMTGATREQCIFILHGPGGNGKSTFALTLTGVWGTEYTQQIKAEILCQSKYDNSEYHIAELCGVRIALACESELRRRLASALIKQWTGGEPMVGRRPYELPIRFTPIAKLWFSTNHLPKIDDTTDSIWRRIYTIPFDAKFNESAGNREKGYETKLLPEASGILNWMIKGCLNWQEFGLNPPGVVLARTQAYREEEDLVNNFIQEKCVIEQEEWLSFAELYKAYAEWCQAEGETPETANAFGRALSEKGFQLEKFNGIRGRKGLRLRNLKD
jgi:putative DNA primase/helicase